MENTSKIFLEEINEFINFAKNTPDKDTVKSKYFELVKKYHPDVNNERDKNILNEYIIIVNNIFEKIINKTNDIRHKNTENNAHVHCFLYFYAVYRLFY